MRPTHRRLLFLAAFLFAPMYLTAFAADQHYQGDYKPPQKGPLIGQVNEDVDPAVPGPETVIRIYEDSAGNQVREFSINGSLYQIQVTPYQGTPYYLLDSNGDGLFESRFFGRQPQLALPQWVLFRF